MHIPVLLAGFLAGPVCGLTVGILAPLLSHLLTGMPPTYAVPLMAAELPVYGLVAGLTYNRLKLNIYLSLIIAMVLGRVMFGLSLFVLGLFIKLPYSAAEFFAGGVALSPPCGASEQTAEESAPEQFEFRRSSGNSLSLGEGVSKR